MGHDLVALRIAKYNQVMIGDVTAGDGGIVFYPHLSAEEL